MTLDYANETAGAAPVVAADLDRALDLLATANELRTEAATLLGPLATTDLARFLGFTSIERLVAHHTGCDNAEAAEVVCIARHLERFPATAEAMSTGRLSWPQAAILARAAGDDRSGRFAEAEAELLAAAGSRGPEAYHHLVRTWQRRVDAELDAADGQRSWQRRALVMQTSFDGTCTGRFRLDPTGAELLAQALDSPPDPAHTLPEPRTLAQRRADTLVELCQRALGSGPGDEHAGSRATVDVVVDIETLGGGNEFAIERLRRQLARGAPITGPGLDRLLCDASFRALVTDGPRVVLAYNRSTPDIPPALRRAVHRRDEGCTFTGCDRPPPWCDVHHIVPRHRGGPTNIDNLTLLCRFHHGAVHEGGWQLTRAPDGAIHTSSP